ncbi:hypothetical protein QWY99_08150 [Flavobacterium branchiarum]|uniref:Uncharacterized protein n=1 Tax=Flavobacterium branchiarum TaxID=1114870 RepID=A0ABV5FS38_9FLAO|nr:hypothetical protein [Flavobacterium branchiarum]MDN3673021.1 hypothetical protein [Flavobacterium branchiarum]
MSNWFENNQTKSVIIYTLVIAGATWAFYKFIFEEQKIDFYKAQVESSKTEVEQHKSRIDFLEKENQKLETVLKEFEEWNFKSSNPTLFYKTKYEQIANEKNRIDSLFSKSIDSTYYPKAENSSTSLFKSIDKEISKGKSYINDQEQLIIGVNDISVDGLCNFTISVGSKINEVQKNVRVGTSYNFGKFKITLSETNYVYSLAKFHISKL